MITHYIPIWAKTNNRGYLAVCQRYVNYATDSDQPTCEDCRRLIAEEDALVSKTATNGEVRTA